MTTPNANRPYILQFVSDSALFQNIEYYLQAPLLKTAYY